jgi:sugar O-acyltransferase (sialic acid O-acetyltransferase NeuD family)
LNKPGIILIGGGGHCKAVVDVVEAENKFRILGILDVIEKKGAFVLGYEVVGTDEDIDAWQARGAGFHVSLGHIKDPVPRMLLFDKLISKGAFLPVICSPRAYVSRHASVGEGSVIMHDVIVNAGATVSANCIINNKVLVEHDSTIGDHCHISTGTIINGNCNIQRGCFIGSGSVLLQGVSVGMNCLIGAGSVVTKSISDGQKVAGTPAKGI